METKRRVPLFFKALSACFIFDGLITIALVFFIIHEFYSPLITFFVTLGILQFFVAYLVWKGVKEGLYSAAIIFGYSACSQLSNMLGVPLPLLPVDTIIPSHTLLIVCKFVIVLVISVHLMIKEQPKEV